jgi:hypothetical protein
MKAEHRKELQTNALADRMGRVIQRMKQRPKRGSLLTVVLVLFVVAAAILFLWRRSSAKEREAQRWVDFARAQAPQSMQQVEQHNPGTFQARLADFQLAWLFLYDFGIKSLPVDVDEGVKNITAAKARYEQLLPQVKDDPVLAPEARYAIAVAEESLAADPRGDARKRLNAAKDLYSAVARDYPKSAHAKDAEKRAKQLADPEERTRIERFYESLASMIMFGRNQMLTPQRIQELQRLKK